MRCPDCSKFVSMDNGEPEANDLEVSHQSGSFEVTGNCRHTRNCADCGTELKQCDHDFSDQVELCSFEGWDALTSEQQTSVQSWLDGGNEVEVQDGGIEVEESGGGRYKKNMIQLAWNYSLEIEFEPEAQEMAPIKLVYNGSMTSEAAASNYEECC